MKKTNIAIIGAGPYGLSVASHLSARGIDHRIFGEPMQFWRQIADAGKERYLKSYCFATDLSTPKDGFSFADYNKPRGLETIEPCSMRNFSEYGTWFQQGNVPWVEPVNVVSVSRRPDGFLVVLASGEQLLASQVVVSTGLSGFAHIPSVLASLPPDLVTHTSKVADFSHFKGKTVAVVGAGQSALEAIALLNEAGASPQLIVRETSLLWQERVSHDRSLWRRLRSPLSGLGSGPRSWALTNFPSTVHRLPMALRTHLLKTNFAAAEGAWWLRKRVQNLSKLLGTSVLTASEQSGQAKLRLRVAGDGSERDLTVDHVIAGTGYLIDVDRMAFLDPNLRKNIARLDLSPRLDSSFMSSVPGLHFVGPPSAASFGPLFRFVVGSHYTSRTIAAYFRTSSSRMAA